MIGDLLALSRVSQREQFGGGGIAGNQRAISHDATPFANKEPQLLPENTHFDQVNFAVVEKSTGVFREGVTVKYAWIHEHRDSYPVAAMCNVQQVSKSGSIVRSRPCSGRVVIVRNGFMKRCDTFMSNRIGIYGSAKIAEQLRAKEHLESACCNTVAIEMREMGLKGRTVGKFTPTTAQADPSKQPAANLLDQQFNG